MNARKTRFARESLAQILKGVDEVYATRGKSVVHVRLDRDPPKPAELAPLLLGPTGNLRAPALRVGRRLIVGFDADLYRQHFA